MRTRPILRRPGWLRVLEAKHKVHARLSAYAWFAVNMPCVTNKADLVRAERWAIRNLRRVNAVAERSKR